MEHRYLKIFLIAAVGLQALVWLANNLINWPTALGAVSYVLSQENQSGYPNHLVPAITSDLVANVVLLLILTGEALAAALCFLGAGKMWLARRQPGGVFHASKRLGVIGCGTGIFVWFVLFSIIGGGVIMMGQAEGLSEALKGSFSFASYCFLTLIYVSIFDASHVGSSQSPNN